jgi:3-oxoacyl-(acyl-carrier-protein) synthase
VKEIPGEMIMKGQRTLSLALCALSEALHEAGLGKDLSGHRLGICMGTTVACQLNDIDFYRSLRDSGEAPLTAVDRYLKGNLSEFLAEHLHAQGPALTVVNACSSGTDAIGVALSWIADGLCDIVVAGGADELNKVPLCGFGSLGIVSHDLCSPFDRDRSGLNLGEGAGVVILESEESAQKRGVASSLQVLGYGSAADAYHLTAPHPEGAGLESAIMTALRCAQVSPEDISFVNAHGTATRDNDAVEGAVLAKLFGKDVQFLSTKGFTGHTLGAAGGIEAVFSAAALQAGWLPASAGFTHRDETIPVMPLQEKRAVSGGVALSTSLAFGGNNAALVIRRER